MSTAHRESIIEEAVIEDVCLLEVEICEQLARMAEESCAMSAVSASTNIVNMPPITAGTTVQLIAPPTTSHQSSQFGTQEIYVVDQDGGETMIHVPSSLLYPEPQTSQSIASTSYGQQQSLAELLHSYAAKETEKETDNRIENEAVKETNEFEAEKITLRAVNNIEPSKVGVSERFPVSDSKQHKGSNLIYTVQLDDGKLIHLAYSRSDVGKQQSEVVTVPMSVNDDSMMKLPELSAEPVPIQKKIPYGMLSGNTLTLIQETHGKNTPPLAANVGGMGGRNMNIPLISKHRLRRRIVTEPGQMPYVCDICNKGFSHAYNLKLHIRAHLDDRPHLCPVCNKGFLQATKLKNHMTTHTKEKKYVCGVCMKRFGYQESLKKHARVHSGEKTFTCKVCDKQFAWLNVLNSHMSTHSSEKRFVCEVCGKCFTYYASLKSHMRRHCNDPSAELRCEICEHRFMYEATLKRHVENHSKDTLHQCDQCDKQFSSVAILERHYRLHNPQLYGYLCDHCVLSFPRLQDLNDHLQNHGADRKYVYDICYKAFVHMRGLKQHLKLHSPVMKYSCPVCEKGFQHRGNLTMHLRTHTGEKPYNCDQCGKTFTGSSSLRRHMRLHSGDRPYTCSFCDKCFPDSTRLSKHKKAVHGDNSSVVVYEVREVITT